MAESAALLVYIPMRSGSYGRWSRHWCPAMRLVLRDGGGRPARCRPSSIVCASGCRRSSLASALHLSSSLRLPFCAYSERERRAGGVGGGAEPTLSHLMVPIKDASE